MEREPLSARRRGIAPSGNPLFLSICSRLVFLALPLLALSGVAQADVRITSITPSCAVAGDHVTLTGIGFGATNVTVKVGGVSATILSATGNLVKFTVPAGVPAGVTVVSAANPGERAGTIALRIRGPEICFNSIDEDCDGCIS